MYSPVDFAFILCCCIVKQINEIMKILMKLPVMYYLHLVSFLNFPFPQYSQKHLNVLYVLYEPRREITGLWGFRPGPTQTGLCSRRSWLEAEIFLFI